MFDVEKLTQREKKRQKNGICLHMSFIFSNFAVAKYAYIYEFAEKRIHLTQ